jgi:putative SOS response-associated peptidase YedK
MAGIWRIWKNPRTEQWEPTFAILTGEPNEVMSPIHNRLATILEPNEYSAYLASSERPPLHLLRILEPDKLRAKRIQKPSPELKKNADPQFSLFGGE